MDNDKTPEYSVGYGRPPRHSQFKPGSSGNPNGRPRKRTTLADAIVKELEALVTVTWGNNKRKARMKEVIAKQLVAMAGKGDAKALGMLLSTSRPNESSKHDRLPDLLQEFRQINILNQQRDRNDDSRKDKSSSRPRVESSEENS